MIELLTLLLILGLIVALPYWLSKGAKSMFRGKGSGGGGNLAGAMLEIDRITRPSVEHLEKMEDNVEEDDTNDGE